MRNVLRVGVGAVVIAAATALTVTSAAAATSATVKRSTTGATASCHFTTWGTLVHDDHAQINCDLSDTLADSHSVSWSGGRTVLGTFS